MIIIIKVKHVFAKLWIFILTHIFFGRVFPQSSGPSGIKCLYFIQYSSASDIRCGFSLLP